MMLGSRRPVVNGIDPLAPAPALPPAYAVEAMPIMSGAGDMAPMPAPADNGRSREWAGILADGLLGLAGRQGVYAPMMERRRQEQTALEAGEQRYQRQRADSRDDFLWKQQNEAKTPTGFAGELVQAGYQPGTPEYVAKLQQHVANRLDPSVTVPIGDRLYVGPRSGLGMATGAAPGPISAPKVPPPQTAIQLLKSDPSKAAQFDEVFGQGAAAQVLGGPASPAPGRFRP